MHLSTVAKSFGVKFGGSMTSDLMYGVRMLDDMLKKGNKECQDQDEQIKKRVTTDENGRMKEGEKLRKIKRCQETDL